MIYAPITHVLDLKGVGWDVNKLSVNNMLQVHVESYSCTGVM